MTNIDLLKQILTTDHEYWVVSKKDIWANNTTNYGVFFICIPMDIKRSVPVNELLLVDLEKLQSAPVQNIPISDSYAPFQHGISMYNMVAGFPVIKDQKKFLIKALELGSSNIYDYADLAKCIL